jgi:hypothetical protein
VFGCNERDKHEYHVVRQVIGDLNNDFRQVDSEFMNVQEQTSCF